MTVLLDPLCCVSLVDPLSLSLFLGTQESLVNLKMEHIVEMHPNTNTCYFVMFAGQHRGCYVSYSISRMKGQISPLGFSLSNVFDMNVYFLNKNILT